MTAVTEQKLFLRFFQSDAQPPLNHHDGLSEGDYRKVFVRFFEANGATTPSQLEAPITHEADVPADSAETEELVSKAPDVKSDQQSTSSVESEAENEASWFARVKGGLSKTRRGFTDNVVSLLAGKKAIDEDLLEEIETQLLLSDVGMDATNRIIESLTQQLSRSQLRDSEALYKALQDEMRAIIAVETENPLEDIKAQHQAPYVVLVVGVNGVGKTTTIGKLAHRFKAQGLSVMLAAGDTFRAAAVEQLQEWGKRNDIGVVAQHSGADSASVIYDAVSAAKARNVDVLIADTAGRLHTKSHLMEELSKVKRVIGKVEASAPHEVLLVLDAGTGQNGLLQAEQFHQAVGVTGIVLTKLDGTAKGGILFAISEKLSLPLRYIGVGEKLSDLRPFDPNDFIKALFDTDD